MKEDGLEESLLPITATEKMITGGEKLKVHFSLFMI